MTIQDLSSRAIVVRLSIGSPIPVARRDRARSAALASREGAQAGSVSVVTRLFPWKPREITNISAAEAAMKDSVYRITVPWGRDGDRLLLTSQWQALGAEFPARKAEYTQAIAECSAALPRLIQEAELRLSLLFRAEVYPTSLSPKVSLETFAMADRPQLTGVLEEHDAAIRSSIEASVGARVEHAAAEGYRRLRDAVEHMSHTLAGDPGRICQSLIGNVEAACEAIDALNIMDDPDLLRTRDEIRRRIASIDLAALKRSAYGHAQARQDVVATANDVLTDLESRLDPSFLRQHLAGAA
jgi:hypothetical protein